MSGTKAGSTKPYILNATYVPHGGLAAVALGAGQSEQWCYNSRMQPVAMRVGAAASADCAAQSGDLLRLAYGYGTTDNNGNVRSQAFTRPSFTAVENYSYDGVNRLSAVTEGTDSRQLAYSATGNPWVRTCEKIPQGPRCCHASSGA